MPNRIIRDGWVESEAINRLSKEAEIFFLRLCLRADDYGRYNASPKLLSSGLYPLKDDFTTKQASLCLKECQAAGLTLNYEDDGKAFVVILKFQQRFRAKHSKFPEPPKSLNDNVRRAVDEVGEALSSDGHVTVTCQPHDGHVTVTRQPHDGHSAANCGLDGDGDEDEHKRKEEAKRKEELRSSKKGQRGTLSTLPPDWLPNAGHIVLAKEVGLDIEKATEIFKDWAISLSKTYADWDACFRNSLKTWLQTRLGVKMNGVPYPSAQKPSKLHPLEARRQIEAISESIRELNSPIVKWLQDGTKDFGKYRDVKGVLTLDATMLLVKLNAELKLIKDNLRA